MTKLRTTITDTLIAYGIYIIITIIRKGTRP